MKNQPPPIAVAHFNRAEVNIAGVPVSGRDCVDSNRTNDGTSSQPNPFRKVKGIGTHVMYSATNISMIQPELKTVLALWHCGELRQWAFRQA